MISNQFSIINIRNNFRYQDLIPDIANFRACKSFIWFLKSLKVHYFGVVNSNTLIYALTGFGGLYIVKWQNF